MEQLSCIILRTPRISTRESGRAGGVWGLDPFMGNDYSVGLLVTICFAKLVAISISVLAGFRGAAAGTLEGVWQAEP